MEKICKYCKFYVFKEGVDLRFYEKHLCHKKLDKVTGELGYYMCYSFREFGKGSCGPEGKYFEEKE